MAGLLTVAAFPPLPVGLFAYGALLPLMLAFIKDDYHLGFEKGYLYGLVLNLGVMYWLAVNKGTQWYWAGLSMLAAVLFLALNYGLIGWLVGLIGRRLGAWAGLLAWPFVWVAVEYLRSFGTMGFTWNNLCYTQSRALRLIQFMDLTGAEGISFLIVLINALILLFWLGSVHSGRLWRRPILVIAGLFLVLEIYGTWRLHQSSGKKHPAAVHAALIQPNVDPNEKWNRAAFYDVMDLLYNLSDSACAEPRDLLVWPETATPTYLRKNRGHILERITRQLRRLNTVLLTGTPDYEFTNDSTYEVYNATFLLRPEGGEIESYRKMKLVPFGEYIPLADLFPGLNDLNLGQGLFQPGDSATVFTIPLHADSLVTPGARLPFSSVICYESSFPAIVRQGIRRGARLLVIVTNDAWYGNNSAPYLHMEIARFRAIENRVPVVRSANTGISTMIDSQGRVLACLPFGQRGWLTASLIPREKETLYTRLGNWFGLLNLILTALLVGVSLIRRK